VREIDYSVNGGQTVTTLASSVQVPVSTQGSTTLAFHAVDNQNNVETPDNSLTVKIDTTPPSFSSIPTSVTTNATRPSGAIVSYTVTASDNNPNPGVVCNPASGSLFAVGTTSVNCTATDVADNVTPASFTVTVKGASAQISDLMDLVGALRPPVTNGDKSNLNAKLMDAQNFIIKGSIPSACNKLREFITAVTNANHLTSSQKSQLIASASQIKSALGCP